jgi:PAS domain S-box-containing protein
VLALVPALGVGAVSAWHAVRSYEAAFEERLLDTARALALAVDREIEGHISTLAALAASPLLDVAPGGDLAQVYLHARRAAVAVGAPVGLINREHRILFDTDLPFGAPLPTTAATVAVEAAFRDGRPTVSDLLVGSVAGRRIVVVNVPVERDGQVLALLATRMEPEQFAHLLSFQCLSGGAFASLADGTGTLVARSSETDRFSGMRVPDWYASATSKAQSGKAAGRARNNEEVVLAFQHLGSAPGWTVMVAEPLASYHMSGRQPLLGLAAGGAVVIGLALIGAVWLGGRVLRPVDALTQHAETVASDGGIAPLVPEVPSKVAEFEALRLAFARADAALRRRAAAEQAAIAALRESEEHHRHAVETNPAIPWTATAEGSIDDFADRWADLTGQRRETLLGDGWRRVVHPDDLPAMAEAWAQAVRTGEPSDVEHRIRSADGTYRWMRSRASARRDTAGHIIRWYGTTEDIHERMTAVAALAESERQNREALERLGEALYALDAGYRVVFASRRALDMWGKSAEEVLGRRLDEVVPQVTESVVWQAVRRGVEEGEETHLCGLSAVLGRWIEADIYPAEAGGATIALRDIDDRRRAEIARARATEDLALNERYYRALAEAGAAAHWRASPSGAILSSRGWEVLTGQSAEEMRGDGWIRAVHPEDVPAAMAAWRAAVAAQEPVDVDFRVWTRGGAWLWVRARGVPVRDDRGEVLGWSGIIEDIDARKRAEAALRTSKARLRDLLATVDLAAVMVRDLDGTIRFWSAGCERLYGWSVAKAVGRTTHDLLRTVYPAPLAEIEAALERDGEWTGELRHRTRRGEEVIVAARKVLRRNADGQPVQVMENVADVTALRRAEEALRESEARFARAVEAARIGTWEWDPATDKLTHSAGREELLGRPSGSIRDLSTMIEAVHPEDRPLVCEAARRVLAGETDRYEAEFRTRWPDGTVRWLRSVGRAIIAPDGTVRQISGVSMDVTEQVEARRRRDLLAREVDHRAKNALSVVQSVLRLTPAHEPKAFAAAVEARVAALARVHSLLAKEGWSGADLRVVVERELAPYAERHGHGASILLDGPGLALGPAAVQPLAMVLHELATNAAKYGALSTPEGKVEVTWRAGRRAGENAMLRLRWSERGGPALTGAPARRGFGSRVIEATVRGQLGGSVERRWEATGLVCEIAVPLARIAAGEEGGQSESAAA